MKKRLIDKLQARRRRSAAAGGNICSDKKAVGKDLRHLEHKLTERIKELNCLYSISRLIEEPDISIEGILQGTVEILPAAMQYPSLAEAQIVLPDRNYQTGNFQPSVWRLSSDVIIHGERHGVIEVCYLQSPPSRTRNPFLVEEVNLLEAVAKRLSRVIERKQAERLQALAAETLVILNDPSTLTDSIRNILATIKRSTGFDAVGIRLRTGDDYPYFVHEGFTEDFLNKENSLLARGEGGGLCRDENGRISLECLCGLVISGRTDPKNPFFTAKGSCWTNDSLSLLDLPAELDPRINPRNTCIHQGYASVALIPIRNNLEIVGLLQLNDRRKGCFTSEMIRFFEKISASIGVAMRRRQTEEELRESESGFRELSAKLRDAYSWMRQQKDHLDARKYKESIIFLVTKEGRICGFTEEAAGMTKRNHADIQLSNIQDIFTFQDGQSPPDIFKKAKPKFAYNTKLQIKDLAPEGPVYEAKITRMVISGKTCFYIVLYK